MATATKSTVTENITVGQWVIMQSGELAKIEAISTYEDFLYVNLFIPARCGSEWMYHNHIATIVDQDYCQQAQPGDTIRIANVHGLTEKAFVLHDLGGLVVIQLPTSEITTAARSLIVQRFSVDEFVQQLVSELAS